MTPADHSAAHPAALTSGREGAEGGCLPPRGGTLVEVGEGDGHSGMGGRGRAVLEELRGSEPGPLPARVTTPALGDDAVGGPSAVA